MVYSVTFTENRKVRCGLCRKNDHFARWKNFLLFDEITIMPFKRESKNFTYTVCDFTLLGTKDRIHPLRIKVYFDSNGEASDIDIPTPPEESYAFRSSRQEVIDAILFADNEYARHGDYIPYKKGIMENEDLTKKLSTLINSF